MTRIERQNRQAQGIREICNSLYNKSISSVYEYCNKINLKYHNCNSCETSTPTIETDILKECSLCGNPKNL
jgi:hypothetical protein